jgi:hypothetical protein
VILWDGDAVFQPRKVDRSGIWKALKRGEGEPRSNGERGEVTQSRSSAFTPASPLDRLLAVV